VQVDGNAKTLDLGAPRPPPSDAHVADAVRRALSGDPRLEDQAPSVSVEVGAVTLSGQVVDFRAKEAAQKDARDVSGVVGVDDQTTVPAAKVEADASIQKQVMEGVYNDSVVSDARNVRLATQNARVTLRGLVASPEERAAIQGDAEEFPGVVAVDDEIEVAGYGQGTHPASADSILHDVIEAIYWDARVETGRVTVSAVAGGDVTLTGTVDSASESRAARADAVKAGAAHVDNRIRVRAAPD
jgi:osmotically-inducible protein OsmY